jgi:hypothetical protein
VQHVRNNFTAKRYQPVQKLKVLLEPLFQANNQECRRADIFPSDTLAKRMRVTEKSGLADVD